MATGAGTAWEGYIRMVTTMMHCKNTGFEANVRKHTEKHHFMELHINTGNDTLHLMDITNDQLQAIHNAISSHLFKEQLPLGAKEDAPECPVSMLTS